MTPSDRALSYLARGWAPIPIPSRSKAPVGRDWPNLRLTADQIPAHFPAGSNIGVVLGDASGGLVDVDLDCHEAVAAAPDYLPPTATFGRANNPRSHWLYVMSPAGGIRRYQDPITGDTMLELRGNGGQTVFPGSVHESGEPIEWSEAGQSDPVGCPDLAQRADRLAARVLADRYGSDMPPEVDARIRQLLGEPPPPPLKPFRRPVDITDRARRYLARMPGAVSGSGGHHTTWRAALAMVKGFDLEPGEALAILRADYNPRCSPTWTDRELQHKVETAAKARVEAGWLLRDRAGPAEPPEGYNATPGAEVADASALIETFHQRIVANPPAAYDADIVAFAKSAPVRQVEALTFKIRGIKGVRITDWRAHVRKGGGEAGQVRRVAPGGDQDQPADFAPTKVTRTSTVPRIYTLHIGDQRLSLDAGILLNKARFKQHFMEHLGRIPTLPKHWESLVNGWLESAEEIKSAPESSESTMLRRDIIDHVESLGESEVRVDVMHGKAWITPDGRRAFRTKPLLNALRGDGHPKLTSDRLCDELRELGCITRPHRIEGTPTRMWDAPERWPDVLEEGPSGDPQEASPVAE